MTPIGTLNSVSLALKHSKKPISIHDTRKNESTKPYRLDYCINDYRLYSDDDHPLEFGLDNLC